MERETLHIMDDQQRLAMVETRTTGDDESPRQLIRYQLGNHLGSASLELDAVGQVISYEEYHPYGTSSYQAVRSQTETPKRYRYTGMERDEETGLNYHSARYYALWLGRWCSADPAGLVDGMNIFLFSRNNPTRFFDRNGKWRGEHLIDPEAELSVPMEYETPLEALSDVLISPEEESARFFQQILTENEEAETEIEYVEMEPEVVEVLRSENDEPVSSEISVAEPVDISSGMPERPSDVVGETATAVRLTAQGIHTAGSLLSLLGETVLIGTGTTGETAIIGLSLEGIIFPTWVGGTLTTSSLITPLTAEIAGGTASAIAIPVISVTSIVAGLYGLGNIGLERQRVGVARGYAEALRAYSRAEVSGNAPTMPSDMTAEYHQGWRAASVYLERVRAESPNRFTAMMNTVRQMTDMELRNAAYGLPEGIYWETE